MSQHPTNNMPNWAHMGDAALVKNSKQREPKEEKQVVEADNWELASWDDEKDVVEELIEKQRKCFEEENLYLPSPKVQPKRAASTTPPKVASKRVSPKKPPQTSKQRTQPQQSKPKQKQKEKEKVIQRTASANGLGSEEYDYSDLSSEQSRCTSPSQSSQQQSSKIQKKARCKSARPVSASRYAEKRDKIAYKSECPSINRNCMQYIQFQQMQQQQELQQQQQQESNSEDQSDSLDNFFVTNYNSPGINISSQTTRQKQLSQTRLPPVRWWVPRQLEKNNRPTTTKKQLLPHQQQHQQQQQQQYQQQPLSLQQQQLQLEQGMLVTAVKPHSSPREPPKISRPRSARMASPTPHFKSMLQHESGQEANLVIQGSLCSGLEKLYHDKNKLKEGQELSQNSASNNIFGQPVIITKDYQMLKLEPLDQYLGR